MKVLGIIPSRFASSRFPGKPLADIAGKSMIRRVYEQCAKSDALDQLVVATDDQRILDHVEGFGGKAVMTRSDHQSGTDRCREVIEQLNGDFDFVINIQGDEPFIQPEQIDAVAEILEGDVELATLVMQTDSNDHIFSKDEVHVVFNKNMNALYFSREPIPHLRNSERENWAEKGRHYIHIGIYGYRTDVLRAITELPKSQLESAESLEQLRWLENGYSIKLGLTDLPSFGVDRPADIDYLVKKFL